MSWREDFERIRAEGLQVLFKTLYAMIGKRVRCWTRFTEEPPEGVLKAFSLGPPFTLILEKNGRTAVINFHEVVELEELE